MKKLPKFSAILFSSLIATTCLSTPSWSLDTQDYLEQLEKDAKRKNGAFSYKSLDENADGTTTITEFSYEARGTTVTAAEINFKNAGRIGENGFQFESMETSGINFITKDKEGKDIVLVIETMSADQFMLPDIAERKTPLWPVNIGNARMDSFTLTSNGKGEAAVVNIPEISLSELKATGGNNFNLGSFSTQAVTGTIKQKDADFNFNFGGISLSNLEYFGLFGIKLDHFEVGELTVNGINQKDNQPISVAFGGVNFKNLYSPDASDETRPFLPEKDLSAEIGSLSVKINNNNVMGWNRVYGTNIVDQDNGIMEGSGAMEGMYIDFGKIPMKPAEKQNLQQLFDLGYEKITMNFSGAGSWDTKTGVADISKYKLDIEDVGSLDVTARISGYTLELARQISKISNQMNFEDDPKKQQALGLQLLAQMAVLSFNKLQIKVEDDSFLNKVIGLQAKKLKQDPGQITAIVGPMTSVVLAPYNIPEFAASIGQALTTFMQGNKSITISSKPEKAIGVTEIIALSAGAQAGSIPPAELIERFNITVDAE